MEYAHTMAISEGKIWENDYSPNGFSCTLSSDEPTWDRKG